MKSLRILSVLLVLFTFSTIHCQKRKTYKAWVTLMDESRVKGVLYDVKEDGILLMEDRASDTVAFLVCTDIDVLKVRRKGKVGKGAWIGAASGALIGAVAGFAQGDDPPGTWWHSTAEEKALGSAIVLAIPDRGLYTHSKPNLLFRNLIGQQPAHASLL